MITVDQLLERVAVLTREVRSTDEPVTQKQWQAFDATLHRFLVGSIGYQGRRVGSGDPCANILRELVDRYPPRPRSPVADAPVRPEDAARVGAPFSAHGVGLPRRGGLRLLPTSDATTSIALPDATDPNPVARITCALGALADLVDVLEYQQVPDTSEIATNTAHVLAAAAVVARHTLAWGPLVAADRPLAIGKHVEAALAAMQPVLQATPPLSFRGLPALADVDVGDTALDRSMNAWAFASEVELRARIPSAHSLHMLVNQGAHMTATLAAVADQSDVSRRRDGATPPLVAAGHALAAADKAWVPGLTTLVRPSTDFITASRELFLALEETRARSCGFTEQERDRTTDSLAHAMTTLGHRLTGARSFLRPLADGKVLYAPARRVEGSPERLNDRLKGRYVTVGYFDIKDLDAAWHAAALATRSATTQLLRRPPAHAASLC
ncbi:hypothetical protein N801_03810 [Knoellia aerolata DSM 18566]|uniref:Uncharacterized protein n=2 Tax=Knoellia TaxID=136099 RepID=A0A0A0K2K6_9MICO|nr:hypothetical protein N801_03810 [Knoellia aerolata DSM 18566]